jgi:hypothetical protein
MKKITTLIALLLVGIYVQAQTINATISVNMTDLQYQLLAFTLQVVSMVGIQAQMH